MNYLPALIEDDVKYICSVIPHKDAIAYFRFNPKDFSKICPGFRASAITKLDVGNLLFRNRNQDFVSSFIEKHISIWLSQIQEHIDRCLEEGDSKELAYLHTLPLSFFAGNVALFFKLIKEERTDMFISILDSAIKAIKESREEQEKLYGLLKDRETDIGQLQTDLNTAKLNLEKSNMKHNERSGADKTLKHSNAELEKLKAEIKNNEDALLLLKTKVQEQEDYIQQLRSELTEAKNNQYLLEDQIRVELEKKQTAAVKKQESIHKQKCPVDMDEFKDYLSYNLEDIGVLTSSEYFTPLKEHLSSVLFQGIPVVINRRIGITLIKCIANALIGTTDIKTLVFKNDISGQEIDEFLSKDVRIVCLDNFLGNFNETILLSVFDNHKDKIVFLTVAYDRTLRFVPDEFFKYCHYLNLNRIEALLGHTDLTEDPSTIEEIEAIPKKAASDSRFSTLLREMLGEFGVRQSLINYKCSLISNEQDLCRMLMFDVLPSCVDVMQIAPYNTSDHFNKYAGDFGRCQYKELFRRWFANE